MNRRTDGDAALSRESDEKCCETICESGEKIQVAECHRNFCDPADVKLPDHAWWSDCERAIPHTKCFMNCTTLMIKIVDKVASGVKMWDIW